MDLRKFKRAVMVILLGITLLFLFNLFYLKGLADAMHAEAERVVQACIESADSKELQIRLQKRRAEPKAQHSTIIIEKQKDRDSIVTMRNVSAGERHLTVVSVVPAESPYIEFEQLAREVRTSIHTQIDDTLPVDLRALDSLLNAELRLRGIILHVDHSEIVDELTGRVIRSSARSNASTSGHVATYPFNLESGLSYRVFLPSLTGVVLRQMRGILFTTLLLIVLLAVAFRYLIRTVMQQRTLEEMKDDFTNNMTHELKTPIAAAYSAADALLNFRQGEDPVKREQYLRLCMEQLTRLGGLVEQILDMSMERQRTRELRLESVDIGALFGRLTALYRLKSDRPVHFHTAVLPADLTLRADPDALSHAVGNLIDNAIKYTPGEAEVSLAARREGTFCILTVSDRGIGIAPAVAGRIFDKFYRVPGGNRHDVKGYGLGLYYVRQVAERHGGRITYAPRPGGGSVFTLSIPL